MKLKNIFGVPQKKVKEVFSSHLKVGGIRRRCLENNTPLRNLNLIILGLSVFTLSMACNSSNHLPSSPKPLIPGTWQSENFPQGQSAEIVFKTDSEFSKHLIYKTTQEAQSGTYTYNGSTLVFNNDADSSKSKKNKSESFSINLSNDALEIDGQEYSSNGWGIGVVNTFQNLGYPKMPAASYTLNSNSTFTFIQVQDNKIGSGTYSVESDGILLNFEKHNFPNPNTILKFDNEGFISEGITFKRVREVIRVPF